MSTATYTNAPRRSWLMNAIAVTALAALAFFTTGNDASASKRVALIIGNSDYQNAPELANPSNDASDLAVALNDLGFDVVVGIDLENREMRDKVRDFGKKLRGADVAMLFYAGHAMQVNGQNYLAPVDARLQHESDLDFETIPLQFIQRQMEREAKVQLIFLDACRDNPLTRSFKTASRSTGVGTGLAEEELDTTGILIAFATNPGNVALDGDGRNSPFTRALLDNIRRPGVEISTLMTDVRVQVREATDGQQTPWINSALLGRFYFNPIGSEPAKTAEKADTTEVASLDPKSGSVSAASKGVENARIEALAWEAVKDSDDIEEIETFLSIYGSGFYGKLAQIRLDRLKAEQSEKSKPAKQAASKAETATEDAAKPADEPQQTANLPEKQPEAATRAAEPEPDPREVARGIQQRLSQLNCNPGPVDGIWGKRSRGALNRLVRASNSDLSAGDPSHALLQELRNYSGDGCPQQRVVRKSAPKKTVTRSVAPQPQPVPQPQQQQVIQQRQPLQNGIIVQQPQHQQPGVIVQQPQHQPGVIVHQQPQHQPGVIVQPQPQPQPRNPIGEFIGRTIIGGAVTCVMAGC